MGVELSIIVPVYNVEKYLHQCVDSILNQTFKDFELILVDDGSPDNCGVICDEYARKDKRVKVIHQKNRGLSAARNTGLRCASGGYICFVDSDDYVDKRMYEKMLCVLKSTGADMVKCGFKVFEENKIIREKKFLFLGNTKLITATDKSGLVSLALKSVKFIVVWNAVYTKALAMKVIYPEGLVGEDEYASRVYLFNSQKVALIKESLYFYRHNLSGLSKNTAINKRPLDNIICLALSHEYLVQHGFENSSVCHKLRKKIAKGIYGLVKQKHFKITIDEKFYCFVKRHLNFVAAFKLTKFRAKGKFGVR